MTNDQNFCARAEHLRLTLVSMKTINYLALALDPAMMFDVMGWTPDPWQAQVLRSTHKRILINSCRQAGKSTTVAAKALHTALFRENADVLLLARAERQAGELFNKAMQFFRQLRSGRFGNLPHMQVEQES